MDRARMLDGARSAVQGMAICGETFLSARTSEARTHREEPDNVADARESAHVLRKREGNVENRREGDQEQDKRPPPDEIAQWRDEDDAGAIPGLDEGRYTGNLGCRHAQIVRHVDEHRLAVSLTPPQPLTWQ